MRKKMAVLMCLLLVSSMVLTTAAVSAKKGRYTVYTRDT